MSLFSFFAGLEANCFAAAPHFAVTSRVAIRATQAAVRRLASFSDRGQAFARKKILPWRGLAVEPAGE